MFYVWVKEVGKDGSYWRKVGWGESHGGFVSFNLDAQPLLMYSLSRKKPTDFDNPSDRRKEERRGGK